MSNLKGDINAHIKGVRDYFTLHPEECAGLQSLVRFEVEEKGVETIRKTWKKGAGTHSLLWLKRCVTYITTFMSYVATRMELTCPKVNAGVNGLYHMLY